MTVNLHNWLNNPAPGERSQAAIHGHPASTWINEPGTGTIGRQPQSVGNPKGELGAVPIVGMSAFQLAMMSGPQPSATAGGKGFNPAQAPA